MNVARPHRRRVHRIAIASIVFVAFAPNLRSSRAGDEAPTSRANVAASLDVTKASADARSPNAKRVVANEEEPLMRRPATLQRSDAVPEVGTIGIRVPETDWFSTFWPMLVVLGMIVACVAVARRFLPQASRMSGGSVVNILARQYLSSKQSLCLVKVGKRVVLVGVTPEAMTTLTEINDAEEIAALAASLQRGKVDSFSSALSRQDFEADGDAADETDAIDGNRLPDRGGLRETETRIRDLVGRIRSMSTAAPTGPAASSRRQ